MGRRRPGGRERGSSAIELVVLTPLLIAAIFAVIQAALVWHARHLALAAAQEGDRLARAAPYIPGAGAPLSDGQLRAATLRYLTGLGPALLTAPTITVSRQAGYASVTVTGRAASLIPGGTLTVHATSRGPTEGFRPDLGARAIGPLRVPVGGPGR